METSLTSPVSALQNYSTVDPEFKFVDKGSQGTLNQDDFFKLLTVQLTSQDPLKPMEDTEFISQMTSFSSLSEMEKISGDMKMMREQQEVFTIQSLIGKQIRAEGETGEIIEGVVTHVARQDGSLVPYIGDRMVVNSQIIEISEVSEEIPAEEIGAKGKNPKID